MQISSYISLWLKRHAWLLVIPLALAATACSDDDGPGQDGTGNGSSGPSVSGGQLLRSRSFSQGSLPTGAEVTYDKQGRLLSMHLTNLILDSPESQQVQDQCDLYWEFNYSPNPKNSRGADVVMTSRAEFLGDPDENWKDYNYIALDDAGRATAHVHTMDMGSVTIEHLYKYYYDKDSRLGGVNYSMTYAGTTLPVCDISLTYDSAGDLTEVFEDSEPGAHNKDNNVTTKYQYTSAGHTSPVPNAAGIMDWLFNRLPMYDADVIYLAGMLGAPTAHIPFQATRVGNARTANATYDWTFPNGEGGLPSGLAFHWSDQKWGCQFSYQWQ